MNYKQKYFKYKSKYLNLKNKQYGGEYKLFNIDNASCNNIDNIDIGQLYYIGNSHPDNNIKLTGEIKIKDESTINKIIYECSKTYINNNVFKLPYLNNLIKYSTDYTEDELIDKVSEHLKNFQTMSSYDFRDTKNINTDVILYKSGTAGITIIDKPNILVIKFDKNKSAMESELKKYKYLLGNNVPLPPLYTKTLLEIDRIIKGYNSYQGASKKIYFFATKYIGYSLNDEIKNSKYTDIKLLIKFLQNLEQFLIYVDNIGYYQTDMNSTNYVVSESGEFYFIDVDLIYRIPDKNKSYVHQQMNNIIFNRNPLRLYIRDYLLSKIEIQAQKKIFVDTFIAFIKRYNPNKSAETLLDDLRFWKNSIYVP